ncbi:hypothetical protein GRI62_00790 [Erythrobacter arachoides]|uniref:Carbohydrate kinase PfkB domain-containing protein n=1 Tax=Aurantiacibacter arachoides TaxID=1850444 RepID=A0A844ZY22_9SPHN|nr:PfkB family carbohydrate kinase [Aurantiacibacter arachoides]MXO92142.1 hypothetical protein [Aurantiacibacter arachoides]GGD59362.1 kinase [Aurantiacibacter arachoides]
MTILCVGRATFDLGYACEAFPAEDGKISARHFWSGAGGSALNGAVTARALGSEVRLLTLLGAGHFADAVRGELARFAVPFADFANPDHEVLPVSSIVVVPGRGSRTVIDQQPPQRATRAVAAADVLDGVGVLYCDGFLPELAVPLAQTAQARGIPVVLDGGSWKPWTGDLIAHVDHAVVSERFSVAGTGETDVLAAVMALGPAFAAITRGPGPITWRERGGEAGHIDPPRIEAIDTLGAGDVFHGATCHFLAHGRSPQRALQEASVVAAESCRYYGTRGWIERS